MPPPLMGMEPSEAPVDFSRGQYEAVDWLTEAEESSSLRPDRLVLAARILTEQDVHRLSRSKLSR